MDRRVEHFGRTNQTVLRKKEYESGYVIDVLEHYSRNFNNPNIDNKRFVIPSVDQSVYLSFLQVYIIFEK